MNKIIVFSKLSQLNAKSDPEIGHVNEQDSFNRLYINGTAHFKKRKLLFEYKHLLLLRDIWWSKF